MELAKIETLLESYFEGETNLQQEQELRTYFASSNVAPHLSMYTPLFNAMQQAQEEEAPMEVTLPVTQKSNNRKWLSIAASVVVLIGAFSFVFNHQNQLSAEEQEALAAFEQSKEALEMLSVNFNKGAEELNVLSQFTNTTNKILK